MLKKYNIQSRLKGFTLLELILVTIISGGLLTIVYSILTTLPKVKIYNDARQQLISESNNVMNRFSEIFQDYTIDYEEYFNRTMVGCDKNTPFGFTNPGNPSTTRFIWTGEHLKQNGHCSLFTAYGNHNKWKISTEEKTQSIIFYGTTSPYNYTQQGSEPYGQYKSLFRDFRLDTDGKTRIAGSPAVGDADDEDLGKGPIAISDPKNIKELYLISHDGQSRLFLRKNIKNGIGTIEILKLRGFDAGTDHKFNLEKPTTYDGEIDTRACDADNGFICEGPEISVLYNGYNLPSDNNDGWVKLFDDNISVKDFNISLSPVSNPDYAWNETDKQKNPYIQIVLTTELPPEKRSKKIGGMLSGYHYSLQSSFDTRGFYIK